MRVYTSYLDVLLPDFYEKLIKKILQKKINFYYFFEILIKK